MRLSYNAPVVLSFTLIATAVMILDSIFGGVTESMFMLQAPFEFNNVGDYLRLITSVIGHSSWDHLVGNFTFILLVGPILEERYGSGKLLLMIILTAVVTSVLYLFLFSSNALGASGIVFMMVLLGSFVNFRSGTIPITFILIACLFLGKEIYNSFRDDNISQFAHILGGVIGAVFGFMMNGKKAGGGSQAAV
jgi:membrane associated rhomboid family serine protease